jgi:predicted DNA-binding transcriptional regulator AlpA
MATTPAIVSFDDAARRLGVTRRTLARWLAAGTAPRSVKTGPGRGSPRVFTPATIELWLHERRAGAR